MFLLGMVIGGLMGVVFMCLFIVSKDNRNNKDNRDGE